MADRGGGMPASNPNQQPQPQQLQRQQIQDQAGQQRQVVHLNLSNFKPAFSECTLLC